MPARDNAAFVRAHTTLDCAAFVPEITLHLASAITPIWQATEAWWRGKRHPVKPNDR